jgi:hypothetical protein
MMKLSSMLVMAAAVGAGAMYWVMTSLEPDAAGEPRPEVAGEGSRSSHRAVISLPASDAARLPGIQETLTIYEFAASAGRSELDVLLRDAASGRGSPAGRMRLHALLMRYAELDINAALRSARALDFDLGLLLPLYQQWIFADPDAVLAALVNVRDRAEARAVALALLRAIGDDERLASRVLAALPEGEREAVRADAILAAAATGPAAALDDALALDDYELRYQLVQQVGATWAGSDPQRAMAASPSIRDRALRMSYEHAVLRTWTRADPESMLLQLARLDAAAQQQLFSFSTLGGTFDAVEPLRLIELAQNLAHVPAARVKAAALRRLAADDPLEAIAMAERLSTSTTQRGELFSAIASSYARKRPADAFDWAMRTGIPGVVYVVLSGIAEVDAHRALDLALSATASAEHFMLDSVLQHGIARGADAASLAQRVLAIDDAGQRAGALQALANAWVMADAPEAMTWLLSSADRIDPNLFGQVAHQVANQDLAMAIPYTERVPRESIDRWMAAVVSRYANADPHGAVQWILGRRGQPGYESGLQTLVEHAASHDLVTVTSLVAELDDSSEHARRAVGSLAWHWIQEDFQAAADWVGTLRHPALISVAAEQLGREWARRDPVSARSWVFGLPPGEARDKALGGLWWAATAAGMLDRSLLDAFSSAASRDEAILLSLHEVMTRDVVDAHELIDVYITDPAARAAAQRRLDETAPARSAGAGHAAH